MLYITNLYTFKKIFKKIKIEGSLKIGPKRQTS